MSCRKKAFIGSIINTVGGITNGLIGLKRANKAKRESLVNAGLQKAQALTNKYNNTEYIEDYDDKLSFKLGGKCKARYGFTDRIYNMKRFACGGKRKNR